MTTLKTIQLLELDLIAAELSRRLDDNFRAWSQSQLRPQDPEVWEALGTDLCRLFEVVQDYFAQLDAPTAWWDAETVTTLKVWREFHDAWNNSQRGKRDSRRTAEMQRRAWAFLSTFQQTHETTKARLALLVSGV